MEKGIRKTETWKALAELFIKENVKALIKDVDDNYYFCEILFVGEDTIRFKCFGPPSRQGEKITLYWPLVARIEECKDVIQ